MGYARNRASSAAPRQGRASAPTPVGPAASAGLGNRALGRLVASAPEVLAAHPSLVGAAGNRAVQRLVNPVQRIDDKELASTVTDQPAEQPMTASATPNAAPPVAHSVAVTNHPYFRKGTTALDGVSAANGGVSAANGGMAAVRFGGSYEGSTVKEMAEQSGVPNLLPGVGLGLNVLGAAESGYRGQKADEAAQAMDIGSGRGGRGDHPVAGPRAQEILYRGAEQQRSESTRQQWNVGANLTQAATTTAAMIAGVTTPLGAGLMLAGGGVGVMKGAYSGAKALGKHVLGGKETAEANAMQVLSDAQMGNVASRGCNETRPDSPGHEKAARRRQVRGLTSSGLWRP